MAKSDMERLAEAEKKIALLEEKNKQMSEQLASINLRCLLGWHKVPVKEPTLFLPGFAGRCLRCGMFITKTYI